LDLSRKAAAPATGSTEQAEKILTASKLKQKSGEWSNPNIAQSQLTQLATHN